MMKMIKRVPKDVWVRVIGLMLVLANQISVSFFNFTLLPFDDAQIYEGVSWVLTIVVTIVTGYYNNDFSDEAIEHTKQMREEKKANKLVDE